MAELSPPGSMWSAVRGQAVALVLGVGVVFGVGVTALTAGSAPVEQLAAAATQARAQADAANDLLLALEEADAGEKGYLLTNQAEYLEPYVRAAHEITPLLAKLSNLADGTPWLQREGAELRDAAQLRMRHIAHTIEVARSDGAQAAVPLLLTDPGRQEM